MGRLLQRYWDYLAIALAILEAFHQGRDDVAKAILLSGTVRAYVRSPNSPHGVQIKDWGKPFPKGTKTVVLVDVFGGGKPVFYVIPAKAYAKIIEKHGKGLNPVRRTTPTVITAISSPSWLPTMKGAGTWPKAERTSCARLANSSPDLKPPVSLRRGGFVAL
jgi:hypothetical protein